MQKSNIQAEPSPCPVPRLEAGVRYLVMTVDCEIFGSGTGDVRQHMITPMERIAALGDQFGMPITFFIEVEEYLAFERYAEQLREDLGYDPARLIREQVMALVRRGHDVQLHLHPQWYGARYARNRWLLHPDQQTVDALFENQEQVTQFIRERKAVLEAIMREAYPERVVRAYRAGGFCMQPGDKLLAALAANDILLESSVVKGLYRPHEYYADYRAAPSTKGLWRVTSDVCKEETSGSIFEIPVHSVMGRRLGQANVHRLRAKFSSNVPKEKQKETVGQLRMSWSPIRLLTFLWQEVPIKLDFHNMSARRLMRWIRSTAQIHDSEDLDILVLIGHTKEHVSDKTLGRLLALVSKAASLKVITFDQLARGILESARDHSTTPGRGVNP